MIGRKALLVGVKHASKTNGDRRVVIVDGPHSALFGVKVTVKSISTIRIFKVKLSHITEGQYEW